MSDAASLTVGPSFTSKGTKYLHLFHLKLCGHQVSRSSEGGALRRHSSNRPLPSTLLQGELEALCTDNVTDISSKDEQGDDTAQFVNSVNGFICQSTIIPADGRGFRTAISSQSVSLADTFIGATFTSTLNCSVLAKHNNYLSLLCLPLFLPQVRQWRRCWMAWRRSRISSLQTLETFRTSTSSTGTTHWLSADPTELEAQRHAELTGKCCRSKKATASCEQGRSSVISVRCNPEKTARGELTVPR